MGIQGFLRPHIPSRAWLLRRGCVVWSLPNTVAEHVCHPFVEAAACEDSKNPVLLEKISEPAAVPSMVPRPPAPVSAPAPAAPRALLKRHSLGLGRPTVPSITAGSQTSLIPEDYSRPCHRGYFWSFILEVAGRGACRKVCTH